MATYTGTSGNDSLTGSSKSDILYGGDGNDSLDGGRGNDTLYGGAGDDTLIGGSGSDLLEGGTGNDTADYSASTAGVTINLATGTGSGGDAAGDTLVGIENVIGSNYANFITGDAGDNKLYGGGGNDTLIGGAGNDLLSGGSGIDTADYSTSSSGVTVNLATGLGYGGDAAGDTLVSIEQLVGSNYNDVLIGDANANALYGGNGDDTLVGGAGADSLYGGAGDDMADYSASTSAVSVNLTYGTGYGGDAQGDVLNSIEALTGSAHNDSLTGNSGANTLYGGAGNDTLIGGGGADALYGGAGIDVADYSASYSGVTVNLLTGLGSGGDAAGDTLVGIENLIGSGQADSLTGDAGANAIFGGSGNDTIAGGAGADSLDGGSGTDTADYSDSGAGVSVNLATGTATGGDAQGDTLVGFENLAGSSFNDTLTGDGNANVLTGGAGNDVLYGGTGSDTLYGGDGNDTLIGGSGSDLLNGGAGIDTADYSASTSAVSVDLSAGRGYGGDASGDTLSGIENLIGSAYNDTLTGDAGDNYLSGGAGKDYISAGDGDDTLVGGSGADTLYGGAGLDFIDYSASNAAVSINLDTSVALYGDAQGDVLSGVDGIIGSAFDDTLIGFDQVGLYGDVFTNVFYGGAGNDYMDGLAGNDILYGGADNDTVLGGAGDDSVYGDAGNDSVSGGDGNDLVDGGTGNDTLTGDAGNDTLYGGAGNDSAFGGTGNDLVYGGDGNDTLSGDAGNDTLSGDAGNDLLYGGDGNDNLSGGTGADTLFGGAGNDVLDGGAGNDSLSGDAGSDTLYGGDGNDSLDGGAEADTLFGGAGDDSLWGGSGNDSLEGGDGNDLLYGGDGNDVLTGGAGNDNMFGGAGADTFLGGDGNDTFHAGIGDFVDGSENAGDQDVLDLTGNWPFKIIRDADNAENGHVNFLDSHGNIIGKLEFRNIETIVSCFTPGTMIATPKGLVAIEKLQVGDMVATRDHGPQAIRWIGARRITGPELAGDASLHPIRIKSGALGQGLPLRDMMVSRQHRMLMTGPRAELLFGVDEVLIRACHLTHMPGVALETVREVTYLHILFDRHEVVLADGSWSESFQPGERSLNGLDQVERDELLKIFPELSDQSPGPFPAQFNSARVTLKAFEAKVLLAA
ncbi:MAG: Hint domain-containing protein [Cypionkella sp.]